MLIIYNTLLNLRKCVTYPEIRPFLFSLRARENSFGPVALGSARRLNKNPLKKNELNSK
jgi:hypothetical protein